eukprot:330423-Hanusia_phi.AAC.1
MQEEGSEISAAERREVEELMLAMARETTMKMEKEKFVSAMLRSIGEKSFPELVAAARKGGRTAVEALL